MVDWEYAFVMGFQYSVLLVRPVRLRLIFGDQVPVGVHSHPSIPWVRLS